VCWSQKQLNIVKKYSIIHYYNLKNVEHSINIHAGPCSGKEELPPSHLIYLQ